MKTLKDKAFFFDLDHTLCHINEPISNELVHMIRELSEKHVVSIVSGKPLMYLSGIARQAGFKNCYLFGENGFRYMSFNFPPDMYGSYRVSSGIQMKIHGIANYFEEQNEVKIWKQESLSVLSIFVFKAEDSKMLQQLSSQFESDDIDIYYHEFCVEFCAKGCSKSNALDVILEKYPSLSKEHTWAFGDGPNDLPLLQNVGHGIVIGDYDFGSDFHGELRLDRLEDLLVYLKDFL